MMHAALTHGQSTRTQQQHKSKAVEKEEGGGRTWNSSAARPHDRASCLSCGQWVLHTITTQMRLVHYKGLLVLVTCSGSASSCCRNHMSCAVYSLCSCHSSPLLPSLAPGHSSLPSVTPHACHWHAPRTCSPRSPSTLAPCCLCPSCHHRPQTESSNRSKRSR